MKSTFYGPRSAWLSSCGTALLLFAAFVGLIPEALAGEKLSLEELAQRTQGAAVVKVELGSKKQPAGVRVVRVIRGLDAQVMADSSWLGLCLPDRISLRNWPIEYAKWKAKPLWRRARAQGSYEALVFVQVRDGAPEPHCGVEAMQMRHTDPHPDYATYVRDVELLLEGRAAPARL